jgi:hypothetical protein
MAATIDDVDAAIVEALEELKGNPTALDKVRAVERYAGELSGARGLAHVVGNRSPVLLVACAGGDAQKTAGGDALLGGDEEVADRSVWLVYVVVYAPQGDKQATKGTDAKSGMYRLVSLVRATLHGLVVEGTFQDRPVAYAGWRIHPGLSEPGKQYVAVVRFTADTAVTMGDQPEETEEPLKVHGAVQKRGGFEDADPASDTEFETTP